MAVGPRSDTTAKVAPHDCTLGASKHAAEASATMPHTSRSRRFSPPPPALRKQAGGASMRAA